MSPTPSSQKRTPDSIKERYLKLALLVIVAGNIYPLIYLRQNFEISILESFGITAEQLGQNYAMLGVIYTITYIPSGWLADRVSPRILMSLSLLTTGLLGIWFSTFPSFAATQIIFVGWGIAAGLTFWSALIKATALLAKQDEQGRFFGILEGGRGLVEAILATIAVGLFAYFLGTGENQDTAQALKKVIWLYVACMLVLAPISFFILADQQQSETTPELDPKEGTWKDFKTLLATPGMWLCSVCILAGYQLYWATYSFSAYLQNNFGLTAVAVGTITAANLWMRPIGAAVAGFVGDRLNLEKTLGYLLLACSSALTCLAFIPNGTGILVVFGVVLLTGLFSFGIRGLYWATLEHSGVSTKTMGLAIGFISLIGYAPHIYLPILNSYLISNFPDRLGYALYFSSISAMGVLGAFAAFKLIRQRDK